MDSSQKRGRLAGAAAIVMSAIILSRLTGFLRSTFIPNLLSDKVTTDAYLLSFSITDFMYNLLVGAAIAAALIPILSGYLARDEEEDGWKVIGSFINVTFLLMTVVCFFGMVFSPQIVELMGHEYNHETKKLAVSLIRILFPSVGFIMLAGVTNGVLNSYKRFAAAAFGPSIYNLGSALSILLLSRFGVKVVAFGVMISAAIYFFFQLSFAIKNMKYYKLKIYLKHPGFKKIYGLAIPSLLSSSIMQVNVLISAYFAGSLVTGSLTAYRSANDVWQMPFGIFAVGIGTAILPSLSEKLALGDVASYKIILSKGMNMVLLFAVPSAMAFVTLNVPIMSAIYKWSNKVDTPFILLSSQILMFFSIAVVFSSMLTIINRAFYANNDTITPLFIGVSSIVITAFLNLIFNKFTNLNAGGIALAYSIASAFNLILSIIILNKRKIGVDLRPLIKYFIKILMAATVMGCVLYVLNRLSTINYNEALGTVPKLKVLGYLLLEVIAGMIVYFGVILIMKVPEGLYILNIMSDKIKIVKTRGLKIFTKIR